MSTQGRIKGLRHWGLSSLLLVLFLCTGAILFESDNYYKISKSIEVFGNVYKEIAQNYVDEIDPEKFMRAGVDGMLETLDPYTVYIGEDEREQIDLLTTGKYAGIGVSIGVRDGKIMVIGLMDGYAAQRQGLQEGDRILEIGGVPVTGMKLDSVRALVRGEPGTELHIQIEREGEKKPIEFVLVREEIQLKNVTYYNTIQPGIGYIRLERFSRTAGDEVRQALISMNNAGQLQGVILDLRDNPGGLLDMAVDVVQKFVPKGSLIVSTKGRRPETEHKFTATEDPVSNVRLVVLVNRLSASASEIVAGAIQDLDRGLIVGTRTFGKGLVQTVVPISPQGAELKLTTARYYTPSGRSIQEIDYRHGKDGPVTVTPDSLRKTFETLHHRHVLDAGGIQPDSVVSLDTTSHFITALYKRGMFFAFANSYFAKHKNEKVDGAIDSTVLDEFKEYLKKNKFEYEEDGDVKLKEFRESAVRDHYSSTLIQQIDGVIYSFQKEKENAFEHSKPELMIALGAEISERIKGDRGRIEAMFPHDQQLKTAIQLLKNSTVYDNKLGLN